MGILRRHPRYRRLSDFVDGTLDADDRRRLAAHLQTCSRCRAEVAAIRSLSEAVKEVSPPRPPRALRERILAAREAGERVILPTELPEPSNAPKLIGVAVAGLLFLAAATTAVLLTTGEVAAGASTLSFEAAGPVLEVEYRSTSQLAGEPRLRLRGRYRTPASDAADPRLGEPFEAELTREEPGRFVGEVSLPGSAVYAAFAVEDVEGERMDTRGGRLWEVLDKDETGRPTFDALVQKYRLFEELNPLIAYEVALEISEHYPERPEGWWFRYLHEPEAGLADSERRQQTHLQQLARLDNLLSRQAEPDPDAAAALADYARSLGRRTGDTAVEDVQTRWERFLQDHYPNHPTLLQQRVATILGDSLPASDALEALEREWERAGPADGALPLGGLRIALRVSYPAEVVRWAERYVYAQGRLHVDWLDRLVDEEPSVRAFAMERIRERLRELDAESGGDRPLTMTADRYEAAKERDRRDLLASLGKGLVAEERREAALDTLTLAARDGWDVQLFGELARSRMLAGDPAGASRLLSYIAVDPLAGPEAADPLFRTLELVRPEDWNFQVERARREMNQRLLASSIRHRIPVGTTVTDAEGRSHGFRELVEGTPTVVAFSFQLTGRARAALSGLGDALNRLEDEGIRTLIVTREASSARLDALLRRHGISAPVYRNVDGSFIDAFGIKLTAFLVVDARGDVRFQSVDPGDAVRQALVLVRSEAAPSDTAAE